jgi:hypothetical protein
VTFINKRRLTVNAVILFAFVSGWIGAVIVGGLLGISGPLPPEFTLGLPPTVFLGAIIVAMTAAIVVANRVL